MAPSAAAFTMITTIDAIWNRGFASSHRQAAGTRLGSVPRVGTRTAQE
jgi:hypothetical protein